MSINFVLSSATRLCTFSFTQVYHVVSPSFQVCVFFFTLYGIVLTSYLLVQTTSNSLSCDLLLFFSFYPLIYYVFFPY